MQPMQSLQDITKVAISLPVPARERLVDEILRSLNETSPGEIDGAWEAEVERRLGEVDQGLDATVPADVVFAEAHKLAK